MKIFFKKINISFLHNKIKIINTIKFSSPVILVVILLSFISLKIINNIIISKEKTPFENLSSIKWKFGRIDGSLISDKVRLLPNGKISGYKCSNEKKWGISDGYLTFINSNNEISTKFNIVKKKQKIWYLEGVFLFDNSITHNLIEIERISPIYEMPFLFILLFFFILTSFFWTKKLINSIKNTIIKLEQDKHLRLCFLIIISIASLCFVFMIIIFTPPNMDEYLPYHQLARFFFPNSYEHIFREPCDDSFDIKILGVKLPLRAYPYCGFSEGIRYVPFYILYKSYLSARFMKLILILLLFYSLFKITKLSLTDILLLAINLPLIFQMLIDTGPVAFQCMASIFFIFILKYTKKIIFGILTGVLLYFAFETKAIFAIIMIPMAIISIVMIWDDFFKENLKEKIKRIVFLSTIFSVFIILTAITFTGKTKPGYPYYKEVVGRSSIASLNINEQYRHFEKNLNTYIKSYVNFGHRVFLNKNKGDNQTSLIWILYLIIIIVSGYIFYHYKKMYQQKFINNHKSLYNRLLNNRFKNLNNNIIKKMNFGNFDLVFSNSKTKSLINKIEKFVNVKKDFLLMILFLLSSIFIGWFVNRSRESWAGHHIVLIFPFLIAGIAFGIKIIKLFFPKTIFFLIFIVAVLNFSMGISLLTNPINSTDDWSKIKVINYLNDKQIAQNNVYVVIDWGLYYLQSIFGDKNQIVLYIDPLNEEKQISEIKKIANKRGQNIIFILRKGNSSIRLISNNFSKIERIKEKMLFDEDVWQLWKASLQ